MPNAVDTLKWYVDAVFIVLLKFTFFVTFDVCTLAICLIGHV